MSDVTIVMYHYVRDVQNSRYPDIKGRDISEFRIQLEHIAANYNVVRAEEVVAALKGEHDLPEKSAWLTFDDGYLDHYQYVAPLLDERTWQGTFFPPSCTIVDRELLDVNKAHFILASEKNTSLIVESIRNYLAENSADDEIGSFDSYWVEWAVENRFDGADVIFVKRMLQHALPEAHRKRLSNILFARHVSVDQKAFAEELYMSREHLKMMVRHGMAVGSHGARHHWLDKVDASTQAEDVGRSLDFLQELGVSREDWIMCYPYGAFNDTLLTTLKAMDCACGVTTEVRVASIGQDKPLTLPRLDTNDLPFS